jgi:lambda repressor-like predicted transcriptional regulator
MQIPSLNPHPLKAEITESGLKLWQVSEVTGISIPHLSAILNRHYPMPEGVEAKIRELLDEVKKPPVACK